MIDPLHALAFSVQANPGVYALLLGSGMSRSARIPTGWEITLDLTRKLAAVCGESCDPDPAAWYRTKFEQEPDYSKLLDALAKTPAERQQLLRSYLEPNDAERAEGIKAPTAAHRAIADLAAKGYIKTIITTNFDRLIETALNDAGVVPTVLSTADQIQGAMPLIHTRCCVIKIHGDYLDTRILNTPAELDAYAPEFDRLLDRVFDEFGLILCGWSAEWDVALCSAVTRSPARRFSHHWCVVGDPGLKATELIQHRQAQLIRITGGDTFFSELQRLVLALEQFSRPHPLSTEAAVASLKSYLAEGKHRIRMADLVNGEVHKIQSATAGAAFAPQGGPAPDRVSLTNRVRGYQGASETLMAMALVGGCWAEEWHHEIWINALKRLAAQSQPNGYRLWIELQRYPATLLLYCLGIGAVQSSVNGLLLLGRLLAAPIYRENRKDLSAAELLPPFCLFENGSEPAKLLEGMDRRHAPLNDWLHDLLKSHSKQLWSTEAEFTFAFDKLEILAALSSPFHAKREEGWYWAPPGCYGYRHDNRARILDEIRSSLDRYGDQSPYVVSGIFGQKATECISGLDRFTEFLKELGKRWW